MLCLDKVLSLEAGCLRLVTMWRPLILTAVVYTMNFNYTTSSLISGSNYNHKAWSGVAHLTSWGGATPMQAKLLHHCCTLHDVWLSSYLSCSVIPILLSLTIISNHLAPGFFGICFIGTSYVTIVHFAQVDFCTSSNSAPTLIDALNI